MFCHAMAWYVKICMTKMQLICSFDSPSVQSRSQSSNLPLTEPEGAAAAPAANDMDSHLLFDVLTLSVVGLLAIIQSSSLPR